MRRLRTLAAVSAALVGFAFATTLVSLPFPDRGEAPGNAGAAAPRASFAARLTRASRTPGASSGVEVTPKSGAVTAAPERLGTQLFTVRNTGTATEAFTVAAACAGATATLCEASVPSATLAPGDSAKVQVSFAFADDGGGGLMLEPPSVMLKAWSPAGSARDSGEVSVTLSGAAVSENAAQRLDRSECVTAAAGDAAFECGDLRLAHALPAIRVLGKVYQPVLIFNSQHARPFPVVPLGFQPTPTTNPAVVVQQVSATLQVNGATVAAKTWSGLSISTVYATDVPVPVTRFALGFDATMLATGIYPYTASLTATLSNGQTQAQSYGGEIVVVNRAASQFGAGWWLAGLEALVFPSGGRVLWVGGDGSWRVYRPVAANTWVADAWTRPDTLRYEPSAQQYVRTMPGKVEVRFDAAGRHVRTRNRLGHWTDFTYTGGLLTSVYLPKAPGLDTGRYYFFESTNPNAKLSRVILSPNAQRIVTVGMNGGRVSSFTDADGATVAFGYTGTSTVPSTATDELGTVTTFAFDAGSRLSAVTNTMGTPGNAADDITVGFTAAESLGLDAPVDASAVYTEVDGPRPDGDVLDRTRFYLDAHGSVAKVRNALGQETLLSRGDARFPGRVTASIAPNGLVSRMWYDGRGNPALSLVRNPLGDGRNAVTRYTYGDARWPDFPTVVVPPMGDSTVTTYDSTGSAVWTQDARGSASRVEIYYNALGLVTSTRTPAQRSTPSLGRDSVEYDAWGNVRRTRTPRGAWTTIDRDAFGRDTLVRTQIDTAGHLQRQYTRYQAGSDRVVETETVGDGWQDYLFTSLQLPEQHLFVRNHYDAAGQPDTVKRWPGPVNDTLVTAWRYDRAGRRVAESPPGGGRDSTAYDAAGNVRRVITRRGHTLESEYDALNRLVRRTVPAVHGDSLAFAFGGVSWVFPRFLQAADGSFGGPNDVPGTGFTIPGEVAEFAYDVAGNLVRADNGDARVRRTYYPSGAVRTDSQFIRNYAGSTWGHAYGLAYTYDLGGRRASMLGGDGMVAVSYAYTADGALRRVRDVTGDSTVFTYDDDGRLATQAGGTRQQFSYDGDGNVSRRTETFAATGGPLHDDQYTHDLRGKVVEVETTQLVSGALSFGTYENRYSGLGHLVRARWADGVSSESREDYALDPMGNVTQQRTGLIQLSDVNYTRYHPATGRLRGRSTASSSDTTIYDASGNVVTFTSSKLFSTTAYNTPATLAEWSRSYYGADQKLRVYDRRTCLVSAGICYLDRVTPAEARTAFEEYRYDALGRRVLMRTRGDQWACDSSCFGQVIRTVWDGDQIVREISAPGGGDVTAAEMENDNAVTPVKGGRYPYGSVTYTHGPGIDAPLAVIRAGYSDSIPWPVRIVPYANWNGRYDGGVGAPCVTIHERRQITEPGTEPGSEPGLPSGGEVTTYEHCVQTDWPAKALWSTYDRKTEWVGPVSWMGSLVQHGRDPSGHLYRRNRYYDPATGRFTQEDPIGLAGGVNAYGFANGDPVSFADPYGLAGCDKKYRADCSQSELIVLGVADRAGPVVPYLEAAGTIEMLVLPMSSGTGAITRLGLTTSILSSATRTGTRVIAALGSEQILASAGAHEAQEVAALKGRSWSAQRAAFWRAEAQAEGAEELWGSKNVARMQRGRAPQLQNPVSGNLESVELNHNPIGKRAGGIEVQPVTPEQHRAVDPFRY